MSYCFPSHRKRLDLFLIPAALTVSFTQPINTFCMLRLLWSPPIICSICTFIPFGNTFPVSQQPVHLFAGLIRGRCIHYEMPHLSCFGSSDLGAPLRWVGVHLPRYCWAAAALLCPRHAEIEVTQKLCLVILAHRGRRRLQSRFPLHSPPFVLQSRIHVWCLGYEMGLCWTKKKTKQKKRNEAHAKFF